MKKLNWNSEQKEDFDYFLKEKIKFVYEEGHKKGFEEGRKVSLKKEELDTTFNEGVKAALDIIDMFLKVNRLNNRNKTLLKTLEMIRENVNCKQKLKDPSPDDDLDDFGKYLTKQAI